MPKPLKVSRVAGQALPVVNSRSAAAERTRRGRSARWIRSGVTPRLYCAESFIALRATASVSVSVRSARSASCAGVAPCSSSMIEAQEGIPSRSRAFCTAASRARARGARSFAAFASASASWSRFWALASSVRRRSRSRSDRSARRSPGAAKARVARARSRSSTSGAASRETASVASSAWSSRSARRLSGDEALAAATASSDSRRKSRGCWASAPEGSGPAPVVQRVQTRSASSRSSAWSSSEMARTSGRGWAALAAPPRSLVAPPAVDGAPAAGAGCAWEQARTATSRPRAGLTTP